MTSTGPKYAHTAMGVINDIPIVAKKVAKHRPAKNLAFDGTSKHLNFLRPEKHIPEHLVKPPVDENALFRVRAQEKLLK